MNGRERVLGFLEGRQVDRLPLMPITMMYASDVIGAPYGKYACDHRVLVEGQIRTAERFGFDYVSSISDPAREAADCGAEIVYFDNQPPAIDEGRPRLAEKADLVSLKLPDPLSRGRMLDRVQASALFRERLGGEKLIEGWVEGPCAEGADLRGINNLMLDLMDDPAFIRDLFAFVVEMELRFAKAQVEAGVDLIGIGDAAASLVGPTLYNEYVWPFEKQIVDGIHALGAKVRLHICGNTNSILEGMGRLGCDIVDLDFMVPMSAAREKMGPQQVLLGNIDPVRVLRYGTPDDVIAGLRQCHLEAGERYIAGAGCEIPRDTPAENVQAMLEYVERGTGI